MATDFQKAARLGACLSKDYAQDLFRLMVNYRDISASEAASRLNIHIRTAQDFLETLADLGQQLEAKRDIVYHHPYPPIRMQNNMPSIPSIADTRTLLITHHSSNPLHVGGATATKL